MNKKLKAESCRANWSAKNLTKLQLPVKISFFFFNYRVLNSATRVNYKLLKPNPFPKGQQKPTVLSAHLLDNCQLSCVIPAWSRAWLLPVEQHDSSLLSSMLIACWLRGSCLLSSLSIASWGPCSVAQRYHFKKYYSFDFVLTQGFCDISTRVREAEGLSATRLLKPRTYIVFEWTDFQDKDSSAPAQIPWHCVRPLPPDPPLPMRLSDCVYQLSY